MAILAKTEGVLRRANGILERCMPILTPLGVALGLIFPSWFFWMKGASTWLFAFLTLVSAMGVSIRSFERVIQHPLPIAVFALNTYILIPLIVWALSTLFFHTGETETGYILLFCIPTAVVATVWCGIYQGNVALSLTILVIATCLAPVITPFSVRLLAGTRVELDVSGMIVSLLLMVVLPSVAGVLINTLTRGHCNDHVSPCLKPFSKIALLFVIAINASQVADRIIEDASWAYVPEVLSALLFSSIGFFLSYGVSRLFRLSHEDTISVTYASAMRNISAALVLAINFFPPGAAIPVICGIVIQQSTCAVVSAILFGRRKKRR